MIFTGNPGTGRS
jgi:SpoVK/Ycf46/Vps4 family AAA+-type ATPase